MDKLKYSVDYYPNCRNSQYEVVFASITPQLSSDDLDVNAPALLSNVLEKLDPSGLLFVYGQPEVLPHLATNIDSYIKTHNFIFKYWIAVRTRPINSATLAKGHKGLLLYSSKQKFLINKVRTPHKFCLSCKQNIRDWGGKKHLMHPEGTALSDIWKHLEVSPVEEIPEELLREAISLSPLRNPACLIIRLPFMLPPEPRPSVANESHVTDINKVIQADCIEYMRQLPDGCVNLAFADPPYNLEKAYTIYEDERHGEEYLNWCNQWLYEYQRILKPSGSLFVVNLPKWSIYHKAFLDNYLYFQNWIAWDALSEPRGKLMPSHYTVLYYTKHPTDYTFNHSEAFQLSPDFCMRAGCIKRRQREGINDEVPLTDIWWDTPRIRHKKFRDVHPCQLPEKLLERIIKLTTKPGDLVFDGLCGAGTTPIVAKRLGRQYLALDIDPYYVDLTQRKLKVAESEEEIPRPPIKKTAYQLQRRNYN